MYFCFFKQKTAYELRISDWSSDVCSSDLQAGPYVLVVNSDSKAEQRRIRPGSPQGADIVVAEGLKEGELVIVEGLQKVRTGQAVANSAADARGISAMFAVFITRPRIPLVHSIALTRDGLLAITTAPARRYTHDHHATDTVTGA